MLSDTLIGNNHINLYIHLALPALTNLLNHCAAVATITTIILIIVIIMSL